MSSVESNHRFGLHSFYKTEDRIIFLLIMRHWPFLVLVLTALWPSYNLVTTKIMIQNICKVFTAVFYCAVLLPDEEMTMTMIVTTGKYHALSRDKELWWQHQLLTLYLQHQQTFSLIRNFWKCRGVDLIPSVPMTRDTHRRSVTYGEKVGKYFRN